MADTQSLGQAGGGGAQEDEKARRDRELGELLQELRVALPGVQVLFAFLLTVPFSQSFAKLSPTQENVYFASVLCTAAAIGFLISPTAYHRIQFREGDKEKLLKISNRLTLTGMLFLAGAISCVMFVITDYVKGGALTSIVTGATVGMLALLWFGLPLYRKSKT